MKKQGERWLAKAKDQRWTPEDAARVLSAVAESGESIEAFARRHGLVAERLYRWRRRLGEGAATSARGAEAARLIPVVVRGSSVNQPVVAVVVGSLKVEVTEPASVPPSWVASLVAELAGWLS